MCFMHKLSRMYKLLGSTQTIKLFLHGLVKMSGILRVTKTLAILFCITDIKTTIQCIHCENTKINEICDKKYASA